MRIVPWLLPPMTPPTQLRPRMEELPVSARRDEIAEEAPEAVARLDAGFKDAMTLMALPQATRSCTRTSNYLERLNAEGMRRAKVIGVFPSKGSLIRLVGTYLIEENDRWAAKSKQYWLPVVEEL